MSTHGSRTADGSGLVLVTGATGNVGAEVVRELTRRGTPLRAAVLDGADAEKLPGDVPWKRFAFDDPSTFAEALDQVDRVFLMRPPHMADAAAFAPFIAATRGAGVRHVAFLSLLGAHRNPLAPHHHIEKRLRASGVPWTILRPSFFMQNLTTTHLADLRCGRIVVPAGRGRTSLVDVRDVGAAAAVTLAGPGHSGRTYDLTGPAALTYEECAGILSEALGRHIVYTRPSGRAFARHMAAQGVAPDFIRVMRGIYLVCRLGLAGRVTTDVQLLLGRPATPFADFARDIAAPLVAAPLV